MSGQQPGTLDINYLRLVFEQVGTEDSYVTNYQRLADLFPALVYVFDASNKRVGYVNKQFSKLLGYTNEDLDGLGYDINKIIFKDDVEKFNAELAKFDTLQDEESLSFDNRLNHKQGEWRYFRTKGTVLRRGGSGKAEALLFVAEDITDSLKNTEELQRTRELVAEMEQLHKYGIYSYELLTDQFTWSDGIYKILGLDKTEYPTPDFNLFNAMVVPGEAHATTHLAAKVPADVSEYENEYSIQAKDGQVKTLLDIAKVVRDEDGNVIKFIGSMRDVTKERTSERELQRHVRDLATSNRELEEFAYVASHDMQEPLRKIITFSGRLKEKFAGQLGPEGNAYLDRMNVAATNMRILIENLLEISRTARNGQPFTKTSLLEVMKAVRNELELNFEEQQAEMEIEGTLPEVEAVPSLMVQLFSNLLNNAIKFRSADRPLIQVSAKELDKQEREKWLLPEQTYYEISIKDNGIGFEPEFEERVFQIFQRLHGKAEYPGSGIGLSICKKIAEKHNGLVYAKSKPGVGSMFNVILPEKQV